MCRLNTWFKADRWDPEHILLTMNIRLRKLLAGEIRVKVWFCCIFKMFWCWRLAAGIFYSAEISRRTSRNRNQTVFRYPWQENHNLEEQRSVKAVLIRAGGNWQHGTARSRRREGGGREMKDPRRRWGDLCSHRLICPLIPRCVDRWVQSTLHCGFAKQRPSAHCGASMPGFRFGLRGRRGCLVYQFTDRENNICRSRPLAKCCCLDMTQGSYGAFMVCQTDGIKSQSTHQHAYITSPPEELARTLVPN